VSLELHFFPNWGTIRKVYSGGYAGGISACPFTVSSVLQSRSTESDIRKDTNEEQEEEEGAKNAGEGQRAAVKTLFEKTCCERVLAYGVSLASLIRRLCSTSGDGMFVYFRIALLS